MKKNISRIVLPLILLGAAVGLAFTFSKEKTPQKIENQEGTVKWLSWTEALEANKKEPKKLFVDVYTNWCGWCKVMDRETFTDPEVAAYMSKNYYCIKLNAEMLDTIRFDNKTFAFVQPQDANGNPQGRGVHTLAYALLDGQMSYPTVVYLTEKLERIMISPGFKKPAQILPELRYTAEEMFKVKKWEDYQAGK